jgi:hypothetical protein
MRTIRILRIHLTEATYAVLGTARSSGMSRFERIHGREKGLPGRSLDFREGERKDRLTLLGRGSGDGEADIWEWSLVVRSLESRGLKFKCCMNHIPSEAL